MHRRTCGGAPLSRCLAFIVFLTLSSVRLHAQSVDGNELSEPVVFSAADSLVIVLGSDARTATLFGEAEVSYEEARLNAFAINLFFDKDRLRASGRQDTTGWIGRPTFTQGSEAFTGDSLFFDMVSRRGRVVGAQTAIEEGFIRAASVTAGEDSTLYVRDGAYTTCACVEDPSYSLRSDKMKLINRKWIYTGPIQLYLYNIPTPLWLPFGFLPAQDTRRSGPLPPTYGEDQFGFYLRDFGWYFAMNDYMDLQLQAGFWTQGSWESRVLYRYNKRYGFDGQTRIDYARFRSGVRGDPAFSIRQTGSFRWTHNQTIGQSANMNAGVNLSSSTYLRAVSQQYDDRIRQDIQSTLRFSKRWTGQNLSVQLDQRQQLATGQVSMTLPSFRFSQSSFKPFSTDGRAPGQQEGIRDKLTMSYSFNVDNRFSFSPKASFPDDPGAEDITWWDALRSPEDYRRATNGTDPFSFQASHRIPVSAPFSVRRIPGLGAVNLNLSPAVNYTEDWFIRTETRSLAPDSSGVQSESEAEFFALRQYNTSLSGSTVFYGLFPVSAFGFDGLRHTLRPNVGFTFRPDFYAERFGYTRTYTDADGESVTYAAVPGVGRGKQQALTFSLNNTFETRRSDPDAPADGRLQTLKLLDLSASTSYNFAADSLKFNDVRLTARTRLLGKVDVDARSTFSAYDVDPSGRTINAQAFSLRTPFGRLTSADITMRTSLRSRRGSGDRPLTAPRGSMVPGTGQMTGQILQNTMTSPQTDFSIPWSLSLDLSWGMVNTGVQTIRRATVNSSFDLSLTPNWKVTGRTGYDFERQELVTSNLALARDFDCWQMSFNWIPFGNYQSWGFDLHVKSGHLRDLLRIRQPKSDVRDRFGSLL
ncbi:MAG: putative LPS assembly protein LptD [Rhodothermales bacterium]